MIQGCQKIIRNPVKYVRWSFLKIATLFSYLFSQNVPPSLLDRAMNTPLDVVLISAHSSLVSYFKFLKGEELSRKNVSSHSSMSKLLPWLLNSRAPTNLENLEFSGRKGDLSRNQGEGLF